MGRIFRADHQNSSKYNFECDFCQNVIYGGNIVSHLKKCCVSSGEYNSNQREIIFLLYNFWIIEDFPENFYIDASTLLFIYDLYAYYYFLFLRDFTKANIEIGKFSKTSFYLINQLIESDFGLNVRTPDELNFLINDNIDFENFLSLTAQELNDFYTYTSQFAGYYIEEDGIYTDISLTWTESLQRTLNNMQS